MNDDSETQGKVERKRTEIGQKERTEHRKGMKTLNISKRNAWNTGVHRIGCHYNKDKNKQ
jgi:hypothetical protein